MGGPEANPWAESEVCVVFRGVSADCFSGSAIIQDRGVLKCF